jgi:hypothetical protein
MSAPITLQQLAARLAEVEEAQQATSTRLRAVELDQFFLNEQVRVTAEQAEATGRGLDALDAILTEVSMTTAENSDMAAALQQRQAHLDTQPSDTSTVLATLGLAGPVAVPAQDPHQPADAAFPHLAEVYAWVSTHVAPLTRKTTTTGEGGGIRWCRQWWEHVDAVERFMALYLAFQELSAEESATWLSVFLRDHLDPHLSVLTSPIGPFNACTPQRHSTASAELGHAELPPLDTGGNP